MGAKNIVKKESVWNGYKFPTEDPAAEAAVHTKMRSVILDGQDPDMFTTVLTILAAAADKAHVLSNPFMRSVFNKEEYKSIGDRLKEIQDLAEAPVEEEAK